MIIRRSAWSIGVLASALSIAGVGFAQAASVSTPAWKPALATVLRTTGLTIRATSQQWTLITPKQHPALSPAAQTVLRGLGATVRHVQGAQWTATWNESSPAMETKSVTITWNGNALSPALTVDLPSNTVPWVSASTLARWLHTQTKESLHWNGSQLILAGASKPTATNDVWIGGGTATFTSDGVVLAQHFGTMQQVGSRWIPLPVAESVLAAANVTASAWNGSSTWAWTMSGSNGSSSTGSLTPPPPPPTP